MSTCEALVDKGRRDMRGDPVREPCGRPATVDQPGPNPVYKFHWCDEHAGARP